MKILKKYQWEIILATVVLIVICELIFFILPTTTAIFTVREEINVVRQKNDKLTQKLQSLNSLDLPDFERSYRLVNLVLLKDKKPASIFLSFDNILAKSDAIDVSLGSISFAPGEMKNTRAAGKKTEGDLVFDLPVKGKYESVFKFITAAEKSYPLISIKSLSGEIGDAADIKLNLTLYIYPEINALPSLETAISPLSNADRSLIDEIEGTSSSFLEDVSVPAQKFNRTNLFE